jgi:hypothetical protein
LLDTLNIQLVIALFISLSNTWRLVTVFTSLLGNGSNSGYFSAVGFVSLQAGHHLRLTSNTSNCCLRTLLKWQLILTQTTSSIIVWMSVVITWWLLCHCLMTDMFAELLLSNGCLCWLHSFGFQQTCGNTLSHCTDRIRLQLFICNRTLVIKLFCFKYSIELNLYEHNSCLGFGKLLGKEKGCFIFEQVWYFFNLWSSFFTCNWFEHEFHSVCADLQGYHWDAMLQAGRSWVRFLMLLDFFFNLLNPSSLVIALWLTQPLTEVSDRNIFGGKEWPAHKPCSLTVFCEQIV